MHFSVSKSASQSGSITANSEQDADAQASAAQSAAQSACEGQVNGEIEAALSAAHKDITDRVERIDPELAKSVRAVLEVNKAERHIRGGLATREKYLHNKTK